MNIEKENFSSLELSMYKEKMRHERFILALFFALMTVAIISLVMMSIIYDGEFLTLMGSSLTLILSFSLVVLKDRLEIKENIENKILKG